MADSKIDSLDVGALERSVNDSAGRVSAIWLSFVAFSAYVAATASMISHRQIFLEDPIKLPTINIDLPLLASAILLPLLYVIYHVYVLLQVVLLARTAEAYNEAVEHVVPDATESARVRQRLANTLFAQLFAGSAREREGILGGLLRAMVWITLAFGPVLVLLLIQVKFLPYQSTAVTWSHRVLFTLDLLAVLLLWSAAVNVHRDVTWRAVLHSRVSALAAAVAILASALLLTFPGEPHTAWVKTSFYEDEYKGPDTAECRTPKALAAILPVGFDRLALTGANFIDTEQLAKIEKATAANSQKPHEGERTRIFRDRNFNCAILNGADLRRADFSGAHLIGGLLQGADLRGARLTGAVLRKASFERAHLDDADLTYTSMQRAELIWAKLPRARFDGAHLERATLFNSDLNAARFEGARLQGANFLGSNLRGAEFGNANLRGATLEGADLTGANLSLVSLQAARLSDARLEGADLTAAKLSGARMSRSRLQGANLGATLDAVDLIGAQLQGANLYGSTLTLAAFSEASVWRTLWRASWSPSRPKCDDAHVVNPNLEAILSIDAPQGSDPQKKTAATPEALRTFVDGTKKLFPARVPKELDFTLNQLLAANPDDDIARENEAVWRACADKAQPEDQYDVRLSDHLVRLACASGDDQEYVAEAIANEWLLARAFGKATTQKMARGLLGLDGTPCPGAAGMNAWMKGKVREAAAD